MAHDKSDLLRTSLIGAVVLFVVWAWIPECFAFVSHVCYGSKITLHAFSIPVHWDDVIAHDGAAISVTHSRGHLHQSMTGNHDVAIVRYTPVTAREGDFNYVRDHEKIDTVLTSAGERFSTKQLMIAGMNYVCWDFAPNANIKMGHPDAWAVDCRPEGDGLRIFFFGDKNLISSFYDGLAHITRAKAEHGI
jgi:hypothetical protein